MDVNVAQSFPSVAADSIPAVPGPGEGRAVNRATMCEREGAATGFAFVAFLIASFVVIPASPPALNDPAADIKAFYVDHASGFQANAYLTGLAAFFFLWFLGGLRAALARAEGPAGRVSGIVTGAGALALALALFGTVANDVLATRIAAEADQYVIRALYDAQAIAGALAAFPLAALTGATAVVARRTSLLPAAVTWLGFLLVPAWLLAGCGVFVESGDLSPTGAVALVVLLAWMAWVLAVSASLLRTAGAEVQADARS